MADSIYAQGTAVWYDDKELGWTDGVVTSTAVSGKDVTITLSNERQGKPVVVRTSLNAIANNDRKLPPLRNAPEFDDVEDLASIPHLNEPSLLRVIQARYAQEKIYTFSGIVLVAVNPFTKVPLYGADAIKKYSGKSRENLEPHLFSIAEETYTAMRQTRRSQTVIISGESGAGKTESAKYIMRYLASVSERASGGGASTVERRILATNPILEAFGNAKTMRNDNSSRFGKYIQILFDESHTIVGARIQTYLLERARISSVQLVRGERTYHIFYQLVAGASAAEREPLSLNRPASEFSFLAGGSFDQDAEAKNFQTTKHALSTIGITDHQITSVFTLLAGLLHLGNVEIRQYHTSPDAILDEMEPSLITAMDLLGIDLKEFRKWTTQKFFAARGENIRSVRTVAQARSVRDGVAKFIYACIFDWLITKVNSRLETNESMAKEQAFIAVLDIYGFEHFERNSFEQFCINYANEKLQHQFTSHVFKIQQKEYASEDINWQSIEFSDNQPTIDLIEGRLGILSILDEESRLAAGADTTFIEKLNWQLLGSTGGKASANFRSTPDSFTVKHYAHSVEYDVEGFLEKNRATVPEEHLELILKSTNMFLRAVVETSINSGKRAMESRAPTPPPMMAASVPSTPRKMRPMSGIGVQNLVANLTNGLDRVHHGPKGGAGARKPTQCSIFRSSLKLLMDTLVQTDIHYIRCIKPNENRQAWALDPALTLAQLRACGVLETVRISLSGYPNRKTYEEFCSRYGILYPAATGEPKPRTIAIINKLIDDPSKFALGRTKVFFRVHVLAILEGLRSEYERKAAITIQCAWRGALARMELAWLQEERAEMERMERERLEQEARELEEIDDEAEEHDAAYWKEDGEDLFVRASRGSYEDDDGSDSQSIAVDPGMLSCDFVEDQRAITPSLEDIPEIPDLNSPTFAKALPPSPRSPSKFGYLQDTESSARKKVESEGVDHPLRTVQNAIRLELPARGRSRSPSRGPASSGKKDARAKSVDARRPATPSKDHRGRPQTPSKPHPEIPKDGRTTPSRGLAVVGFFKRSKKDDDKKRKEDEEKEKKKKSKKDGGGDKDKKGKHAKVLMRPRPMARPPTPPTPTPPPRTRPSGVQTQTANGAQVTPIYNRFMRQPSPWFLEGQSQQQKSFAPQQQQQRA